MGGSRTNISSLSCVCVCVWGGGGGFLQRFLFVPLVINAGEAIGPKGGSIASRGRSVPDFLRKPIATCDFPGGGGPDPLSHPPFDPRMLHNRQVDHVGYTISHSLR